MTPTDGHCFPILCVSVKNRCTQNISSTTRTMSPLPSPSPGSSTIIANTLLVQASPPTVRSPHMSTPTTPIKPVSHFQKLLHHFNGNRSLNSSFMRGTPLTASQTRAAIKTNGSMATGIKPHVKHPEQGPVRRRTSDDCLPPPPPPEMAHEQLLDMLLHSNRARISSISPSASTSSATTHTSMQRSTNPSKQHKHIQLNPASISPSMSNSDLSFSPSVRNTFSPSEFTERSTRPCSMIGISLFQGTDTFSGYELGPMSKSVPASMIESQTWSPPRYITTPASNSPSNHTCYCGTNVKDDLSSIREDEKISIARHWLYDEMTKLLKATTKPGLVLLSRTPGMGKTWLMKHLLRSTGASQPASVRNDTCTTTFYAGSPCAFLLLLLASN